MVHRLVALGAVILIATLAVCLLDAVGDGDLCGAWAVPSIGLAMVSVVTLTGRVLPEADEIYLPCLSDRLAPPPRA
jgi:hypothetical protein